MSIFNKSSRRAVLHAYYAVRLKKDFSMTEHTHDRCEIMYVLKGQCSVTSEGRRFILRERQFIFLDHNVPHSLVMDTEDPCNVVNLEFACVPEGDGADLSKLGASYPVFGQFLQNRRLLFVAMDTGKLGYALKDLIDELEARPAPDAYLCRLLFTRALAEIAKCSVSEETGSRSSPLRKAVRFISEHLYTEISVADVAAGAGVNASYLQALFSRQFGLGIMGYINAQRLDHACFLLKNSNSSIMDIAFQLGYNSRQHFGYLFRKRFGMSPRQYRSLQEQTISVSTGACQQMADKAGGFRRNPL